MFLYLKVQLYDLVYLCTFFVLLGKATQAACGSNATTTGHCGVVTLVDGNSLDNSFA